jgi:hypothetical protein
MYDWNCARAVFGFGLVVATSLAAGAATAWAGVVVVPNADANIEGNTYSDYPFNVGSMSFTSERYQQVYAASQFAAFGGQPQLITQIAFRPDALLGSAFDTTFPDIRITLSTTSKAPGGLSATFADNIGADATTVYDGALRLFSDDTGPPTGPKDFDITIPLMTRYLYDPQANENLLIDVEIFQADTTTRFDAEDFVIDPVESRLYDEDPNGINDPMGHLDRGTQTGLVTQFTFQAAVPEPSSLALFGLGAAGLAIWRRRRRA